MQNTQGKWQALNQQSPSSNLHSPTVELGLLKKKNEKSVCPVAVVFVSVVVVVFVSSIIQSIMSQ